MSDSPTASMQPSQYSHLDVTIRWRWGVICAAVLSLLSLYPQFHLWLTRGEYWQDAVAYNQGLGDEVAYAAYVKSLIEGKPRRNDPYTGRQDNAGSRLPESLFSIQFVPAYMVALPARALGISATTAFMFVTPLVAFCSGLLVFWFVVSLTHNNYLAACGVLVVLCLGTLAAGEGTFSSLTGRETHFDFFPFLRRYEPSVCFPFFLLFFILVCRFLKKPQRAVFAGFSVGSLFAVLVFSYFYLWTASAAWLAVIVTLSFISRPADRHAIFRFLIVVVAISTCALIPYFAMIFNGLESTRTVQSLVSSRKADLFSVAELLGAAVLIILAWGVRRNHLNFKDTTVIAAVSFALLPFVVLNQQIITGRVLQPIHYKGFVTSYSVLIAFVIVSGLQWQRQQRESSQTWQLSKRALLWIAIAAFDWGFIEARQATKRSAEANNLAAQEMHVYAHFDDQFRKGLQRNVDEVMLFDDLRMADGAPAASPFPVLWAPHMVVYPGVAQQESKERLFKHLYYTGVGVRDLDDYFHGQNVYYGCAVGLFGFDRFIDGLNPNAKPITTEEKNAELQSYSRFVETFDKQRASSPRLSHVIVAADREGRLQNLDRWYQRDGGEQVGKFKIYRVKLRDDLAVQTSVVVRESIPF
ncbi:MAG TPA: hypothetical protein VGQ39_25815 [Pyrinomonadaceae bacterium]|jgi:hypothetical protein|nr:hypothetical protein [Pyrinomonadaceae bacterium]